MCSGTCPSVGVFSPVVHSNDTHHPVFSREKHAKCEMHRFDLKACYTCLVKGFACSYDVERMSPCCTSSINELLIDDVTAATLESEKSEDASCGSSAIGDGRALGY